MSTVVRGGLVVAGILLMLVGLGIIGTMSDVALVGLQVFGFGAFLVVAVAIERTRYRSDTAEKANAAPGPGGGEPKEGGLDPRFRMTERGVHRPDERPPDARPRRSRRAAIAATSRRAEQPALSGAR